MGGLSGFFGGGKSKSSSAPWKKQQPYILTGFESAQNLLNQGAYPGPYWSGIDPAQQWGYGQMYGSAQDYAPLYGQYGTQAVAGFDPAMQFYGDLAAGNIAASDPYATPMPTDIYNAQVDALTRDDYRNTYENLLPSLGTEAAATGNVNSSDRWTNQALIENRYLDRRADVGSDVMGDWYRRRAENERYNIGNRIGGADALMNMADFGFNQLLPGAYGWGQQGAQAGDYMAGLQQAGIDYGQQEFYAPWMPLQNYWDIVSGRDWGGTTKSKSSQWGISG